MIYLIILSIILSLVAIYKSHEAQKDNYKTLELLSNHISIDCKGHKNINKVLELLWKYVKKEGAE